MKCTFPFSLFLFYLLMSFAFAKPTKDSSDKEYIAIFKDIENSDYKTAIEKLKVYHSKGKSQERSDLLLGQLYVMDKDYPSAFNVFFEIPKKERDIVYLTIVIDSMNKQFAENKKIEKNEAVTPVIMSFLDKNTKYSQKSKDLMKAFLSYYPDSSLEKKYCEDLQKKNQEKCDLEKGIR